MANNTIRQAIKTASGQLQTASAEELSAQLGRSSAPTSPLETSTLGANKDSAKMAGTPNQKTSALRQAIQGSQDLATTLRQEQVRTEQTAAEKQAIQKAGSLQGLGSLESRVQQLVPKVFAAQQKTTVQLPIASTDKETVALLEKIRANPADTAALNQLNVKLGKSATSPMTAQEVLNNFDVTTDPTTGEVALGQKVITAAGQAAAADVQNQITLSQVKPTDLGFKDYNEMASLLGTDAASIQKMTPAQVSEKINSLIAQEYSTVADLTSRANDPALGAAERAEARKQLREMGAVGIRTVESEADKLADEIAEANTVTFLGEEKTLEELLSDDNVTGMVERYFNDPQFKAQVDKEEPGFSTFINKYKTILEESIKGISSAAGEQAKLQYNNQQVKNTSVGTLPDEIVKRFIPNFGEFSDTPYQLPPVMQALNNKKYTEKQRQTLFAAINDLAEIDPNFTAQLANMTEDEIKKAGLLDNYDNLKTYLQDAITVRDTKFTEPNQVANFLGFKTTREAEELIREMRKRADSGLFTDSAEYQELAKLFPMHRDPSTWSKEDWLGAGTKLKGQYANFNMVQLPPTLPNFKSTLTAGQQFITKPNPVYDIIAPAISYRNGVIDSGKVTEIVKNQTVDNISEIYNNKQISDKLTADAKADIQYITAKKLTPEWDKLAESAGMPTYRAARGAMVASENINNPENYQKTLDINNSILQSFNEQAKTARESGDVLRAEVLEAEAEFMQGKIDEFKQKRLSAAGEYEGKFSVPTSAEYQAATDFKETEKLGKKTKSLRDLVNPDTGVNFAK